VTVAIQAPLSKRISQAQWMAIDAVIAVLALLFLVAYVRFGHHHHVVHGRPIALLYALAPVASLPLALRRRWPVLVLAVVLVASVAFASLDSATATVTGATYVLYTVAVQGGRARSLLALAAVEIGVVVSFALSTSNLSNPTNAAFAALVQLTVWLVGDGIRRYRAYAATLEERSVQEALTDQRLRIARELHDVVAHAMSVVAVQAGVGSHVVATQPDEAAKSLKAIESTARAALAETRYLLGVLRTADNEPPSFLPSPGIGNVSTLIDQVAGAGLPVALRVEGAPRPLSPSLELSAYRIVQESLTNIVRHARQPTGAAVVIRYDDKGGLMVEVTDDGHGPVGNGSRAEPASANGSGHGLTGMRERVSLFGGDFHAGPRPEGGFRVVASLAAEAPAQ
jgi:signal transduction histidine kinase